MFQIILLLLLVFLVIAADGRSKRRDKIMSEALERLKREVAESKTATASAVALIGGLAAQLRDIADDEDAINALADSLDEQQAEIAGAVVAGTPSAEEPAPAPAEEADTTLGGEGDDTVDADADTSLGAEGEDSVAGTEG